MKKVGLVSIVFLALLGVGFLLLNTNDNSVDQPQKASEPEVQSQTSEAEVTAPNENQIYSLEEVSKHADRNDCWLALHGKVYNVTEFISSHPGGNAILEGCGKDATELFETRPMGSGNPHSPRARELSEQFIIGNLE